MTLLKRTTLAVAIAVVTALTLVSLSSADTGHRERCQPHAYESHNNDWAFFWGHKIRANAAACVNTRCTWIACSAWLPWTKTPDLTFPNRYPIPTGERISVARKPFVAGLSRDSAGHIYRVKYQFSLKSCGGLCQTFDFRLTYSIAGTKLCVVGGVCDDFKGW